MRAQSVVIAELNTKISEVHDGLSEEDEKLHDSVLYTRKREIRDLICELGMISEEESN